MRKCHFCHKEIQDASRVCEHCGKDLVPVRVAEPIARTSEDAQRDYLAGLVPPPARVSVVDINMPFASMVGFMIKWALAAVPALLILAVFGVFLGVVLRILVR